MHSQILFLDRFKLPIGINARVCIYDTKDVGIVSEIDISSNGTDVLCRVDYPEIPSCWCTARQITSVIDAPKSARSPHEIPIIRIIRRTA